MSPLARVARSVVAGEFVVALAIVAYVGVHDFRDVFVGAPSGVAAAFTATCAGVEGASCRVAVHELSAGRYRLATDVAASAMTIAFDAGRPPDDARHVLVSVARPASVKVEAQPHHAATQVNQVQPSRASRRTVIPVGSGATLSAITFVPDNPAAATPLVVTEFGLFARDRGLTSDARPLFDAIPPERYHGILVPRVLAQLCFFSVLAAFFVPAPTLKRFAPATLTIVCFSLCIVDLAILYSPFAGRDLRAFYASGPLQEIAGSNLNGAIWEATRLLAGRGFTVADGLVSWAKMPGYGLFAAVAGLIFGHRTMVDLAIATVLLQVLFYSAAVGFFAWCAGLLWRPPVVWALGVLIAMLPKQLGYTQVDSIIAPIALVGLGALCLRYHRARSGQPVSIGADLFVHLAFAVWFLMRPDVLPAWAIVSLVLHARNPRRLLLPAALAVAIGVGWAGYKMRYTGEFVPTTSTTGASLLCGLWEVPSRFPWVCSDESYFAWVSSHTRFDPKSQAGSNAVVREVIRFWLTYPGHFVFMVYDKFMRCVSGDLFPGIPTKLQESVFEVTGRAPLVTTLLTAIALAVTAGYERARTLLLAWPLLLNAPVFWIMQTSEGRYYGAVGVALLVAAVPLLLDAHFYGALLSRYRATAAVLVAVGLFAATAWPLHDWLLHNEAFHYWTPFLDASTSSFAVLR